MNWGYFQLPKYETINADYSTLVIIRKSWLAGRRLFGSARRVTKWHAVWHTIRHTIRHTLGRTHLLSFKLSRQLFNLRIIPKSSQKYPSNIYEISYVLFYVVIDNQLHMQLRRITFLVTTRYRPKFHMVKTKIENSSNKHTLCRNICRECVLSLTTLSVNE